MKARHILSIIFTLFLVFGYSAAEASVTGGSIAIDGGAQYTNSAAATLSVSCTAKSGCTWMQFSSDNTTWSTPEAYAASKAWTLTTGDGTKTVYVRFSDSHNAPKSNSGWSTAYSDTILLDTVPPQCSVTINNGAAYTNSTLVTLTLSATDPSPGSGVGQMCVSNASTSCSTWVAYGTSMAWTLPSVDGSKTVYTWFKDNAGNVTATPSTFADSIILDATAPTGSVTINSGAAYTNTTSATLSLSCTDTGSGCAQMQFSNDNVTWSTSEIYSATKAWTLTTGDGTKTVYVKFKDNSNNWSTAYSDTIILDTAITVTVTANDPTATEAGPTTGQFTVTRTGSTTSALTVYFAVSGTATSGSDYNSIGTSVTIPAGSASATITVTPINDTLVESDETVIVTLSANSAYTIGTPSSATVTITSDDVAINPALIGVVPGVGPASDIVVNESNHLAYVASRNFGLSIVDFSNKYNPQAIGASIPPFDGRYVGVAGSFAAVTGSFGLKIVNISDPHRPVQAAEIKPLVNGLQVSNMSGVAMSGQYAYLLEAFSGVQYLKVVDLSGVSTNPDPNQNPPVVGQVSLPNSATRVIVVGSLAYVAGYPGLVIVDISTPSAPRIVSTVDTPGTPYGVAVANGYAYVADYTTVQVINVQGTPSIVTSLPVPAIGLALAGNRLYVITTAGELKIIDVSTPSAPFVVSTSNGYYAQGISVSAAYSLVFLSVPTWNHSNQDGGVHIIDVTNTSQPIAVRTITVPGLTTSVTNAGNFVYAGDGDAWVDVIGLAQ